MEVAMGRYTVTVRFNHIPSNLNCWLTAVYGPARARERKHLWTELKNTCNQIGGPWIIGGDFNTIRYPEENNPIGRINTSMRKLSDFILDNELLDLLLEGTKYTWTNSQADRDLSDSIWICVNCRKLGIWEWAKVARESQERVKAETLLNWANWKKSEESQPLGDCDHQRRMELKVSYKEIIRREEINWRQKSRVTWLKVGDNNSRFFHRMANFRRRINHINSLTINNVLIEEPGRIKESVVNYCQDLYCQNKNWPPKADGLAFKRISEGKMVWLEREFSMEEIEAALHSMKKDKAPGQMGFRWRFTTAIGK
ncbi:uncharacterized protein LOC143888619 [Tasmannia lanceolata]|uniref:uncharacterized protein LOC143888619 n=1 Tax=Tasmannia lanceolata TaxID=3420 RepID=UPI0040645922